MMIFPTVVYAGFREVPSRKPHLFKIPSRSLTWPLKSYLPNWKVVFRPAFFRVYVKLRGCNSSKNTAKRGSQGKQMLKTITLALNCWTLDDWKRKLHQAMQWDPVNETTISSYASTVTWTLELTRCQVRLNEALLTETNGTWALKAFFLGRGAP